MAPPPPSPKEEENAASLVPPNGIQYFTEKKSSPGVVLGEITRIAISIENVKSDSLGSTEKPAFSRMQMLGNKTARSGSKQRCRGNAKTALKSCAFFFPPPFFSFSKASREREYKVYKVWMKSDTLGEDLEDTWQLGSCFVKSVVNRVMILFCRPRLFCPSFRNGFWCYELEALVEVLGN